MHAAQAYEISSDNAEQLMRAFLDFCEGHSICADIRENFAWRDRPVREGRQLRLFDFPSGGGARELRKIQKLHKKEGEFPVLS